MAHDLTGVAQQQCEIPEGGSLGDLWEKCVVNYPRLKEIAGSIVIAVNQEILDRSHPLRDGDEIAFLPPVSGGAEEDFCRITRERIPTDELSQQLKAAGDGAVVVFEGIVRDNSHGKKTLYLEYEGYEPMALKKMEEIRQEVKQKYSIDRVMMIHRLGRLEIGETSVTIIVTSAHRRAAFEACHYAIDRLKQIVPIWKKEYFEGGAIWAEGEHGEAEIRNRKLGKEGSPVGFLTRNKP
jgi:molybdopterin synthase catalytic subunit